MAAVGSDRVSSIVGYTIKKGNFSNTTPNLPQRIAIIGEANTANQGTLDTAATEITSAQQAGELYGYGSPIYLAMRILKPLNSDGVGGIPVYAYPQLAAGGATAKIITITPVGTATKNGVHTIKVAGREGLDGSRYDITVESGDTSSDITQKIEDALNNVLGCPFSTTSTDYETICTSKWKGLTANDLRIEVEDYGDDLGIDYTVATTQAGAGTPSITSALTSFGSNWNTIVVNTYGLQSTIMDSLEDFNGIADPDTPTGRYTGTIMKPFIAISGSVSDDPSATTDARKDEMTIAVAPAPNSYGLPLEAAANMTVLFSRISQDTPHQDVINRFYPDMPVPTSAGTMASYANRDIIVKKGCSTVDLVNGKFQVKDFVTTYHPVGENPPQFRYCRNIMLDLNVYFAYYLKEAELLVGSTIASNDTIVDVDGVIKPKQWIQVVASIADDLGRRALITDPEFMKNSIDVDISSTNPDRLETTFSYKRSAIGRISSTTATAGFQFGS